MWLLLSLKHTHIFTHTLHCHVSLVNSLQVSKAFFLIKLFTPFIYCFPVMVWQPQAVMSTLLYCNIVKFMSPKYNEIKTVHTVIAVVNHLVLFYIFKYFITHFYVYSFTDIIWDLILSLNSTFKGWFTQIKIKYFHFILYSQQQQQNFYPERNFRQFACIWLRAGEKYLNFFIIPVIYFIKFLAS